MTAYRYSLLNALGDLPDDIILEAELPEASPEPSTRSPFWVGMSRFFNSGWGVAAVCFVVAIGVIAGILITSQGEFGHGRTETTATETVAPVEPVTSGESETEAPTEPGTTETESLTETEAPTETEALTEPETETVTEAVTEAVTEDTYLYWDGVDGSSLGGGKGTYDNPYLIKTPAHLSYLSYCLRAGINCADKYFRLEADLDLQGHPWIPIGIREVPFEGVFDGNGHTIRNLYINEPFYGLDVSAGRTLVAGLFGYVKGGTIKNLTLENPRIDLEAYDGNMSSYYSIYAGMLVGRWNVGDRNAQLYNCQVLNADLQINGNQSINCFTGHMVGYISAKENGIFEAEQIQCLGGKTYVEDVFDYNAGVFAGRLDTEGLASLRDICMEGRSSSGYIRGQEYLGVCGTIRNTGGRLSIKNMWTRVANPGRAGYVLTQQIYSDSDYVSTFNLQNAFGYNTNTNNSKDLMYFAIEERVTFNNCAVTKTLPENHGFSPSVWDLSDLSAPRLIFE